MRLRNGGKCEVLLKSIKNFFQKIVTNIVQKKCLKFPLGVPFFVFPYKRGEGGKPFTF